MKQKIFLYLFLFVSLIVLYQFVSTNNLVKANGAIIAAQEEEVGQLQDSIKKLGLTLQDLQYFSLDNNADAMAYYEHLDLEKPSDYLRDKLIETNESSGDNPLVPYESMGDNPFKINKIKVLNHKWILADFSDGKYWGELLIRYDLRDDLGVDFTLIDHLLYTRSH